MRIVYVFDADTAPDAPHPYAFRAPRFLARLVCRFSRNLDYALSWYSAEDIEAAAASFMATLDTTI